MPAHPADLTLLEAAALLRGRALSAAELLEACQERIERRNGGPPTFDGEPGAVNAWIRLYPELAAELARAADERLRAEGEAAPLVCGIPLAVKDLYAMRGVPVTASSRVLEDAAPSEADSAAWARLRAQGMVAVGHTHTHEFAAGGTTDQVGNPWALDRTAGGSSGGSAAALAARMVPAALGTDTCGSLRIPAALSGISTIKPARGMVPLDGVVPLCGELDHAGPMTRTVADAAALLRALAPELGDLPLTAGPGPSPLAGLTVATTSRAFAVPPHPDVAEGYDAARAACERLGATVIDVPPAPDVAPADLGTILLAGAWAYHRDHAGRADRYRPSIAQFAAAARQVQPAAREAAARRRAEVTAGWEAWFSEHGVDLVLEPTVPLVAEERGEGYDPGHADGPGDPLIVLTATWNITGFPVAALPAGLGARSGLPVGVSLIAMPGDERRLVQAAIDLQEHALAPPGPPPGLA